MKKVLLSVLVIGAFIFYALSQNKSGSTGDQNPIISPQPTGDSSLPTVTTTIQDTPTGTTTSQTYKDGTYTGNSTDAFYGNVQVQAVIKNGKIVDVIFLSYPNDRGTSVEINSGAMPLLKSEAITAQSATVDTVSGASQTSAAFRQSLQSALTQAQS